MGVKNLLESTVKNYIHIFNPLIINRKQHYQVKSGRAFKTRPAYFTCETIPPGAVIAK